jgi:single-strand DNA-binding protein
MSSVNKVILLGRIGNDPAITTTKDGSKTIAKFSLATNDYSKGADGKQKTQWHSITVFEPQSKFVQQYLKKGNEVYLEGRLDYNEWETDGVKKYRTEVICTMLQSTGSKKDNEGSGDQAEVPAANVVSAPAAPAKAAAKTAVKPAPKAAPAPTPVAASDVDDDLPF